MDTFDRFESSKIGNLLCKASVNKSPHPQIAILMESIPQEIHTQFVLTAQAFH